jgi:putative transposase
MGNHFRVEIKESKEELEHRLRHAITASSKERLQMLYWLKTDAIATRQELAKRLGRNPSTVYRWLNRYQHGGISALLVVKTPPGMDNGSFHKSLYLQWPDNIIPIFQPSHSPELNPIERLWEHIKQALSWEDCTNLTQLRGKLTQVLNSISRKAIASICGWDYITKALLSATS